MPVSLVQVQKLRLGLNKPMQDLKKQTVGLETALKSGGDAATAADLKKLRAGIKETQTGLLDALDKALTESNDAKRAAAYKNAAKTAGAFYKMLKSDPRVSALEANPFSPVPAIADMQRALVPLIKTLAA